MNNSILVGPLLGFEDGDYYTVCVLLPAESAVPSLVVSSQSAPVVFRRAAVSGENVFWRAEFVQPIPAGNLTVDYRIEVDGLPLPDAHKRTGWSFFVPGANEQPLIAYTSCNGFSSATLARDTDRPYALWEEMCERHQAGPYALLLMGGDQVYADEIWESDRCPNLRRWGKLSGKKQLAAKPGVMMNREIAGFYDWLYTDRWSDESMSLMLASVPSVMMWDDHDIFDGWGSYPDDRQNCDVFKAIFREAARCFDVFQLRCGTRNRLAPDAGHRSLGVRFRDHHILALDNRSERTLGHVMSKRNWDDTKAWLAARAGTPVENLLVMTGVPVAYRSFAAVEAIMDATPWHEELEDDVNDHWSARSHEAERMTLIMVLLNFLEAQKSLRGAAAGNCKGVLLSGDVHVGALAQLWCERKEIGLFQLISSGIVHPPPSAFAWAGIQLMTSDSAESLGEGEVVAEMLTPLGAPRYLRTRNFATLQTGTDGKLWFNWVCENKKWRPSFAWS